MEFKETASSKVPLDSDVIVQQKGYQTEHIEK